MAGFGLLDLGIFSNKEEKKPSTQKPAATARTTAAAPTQKAKPAGGYGDLSLSIFDDKPTRASAPQPTTTRTAAPSVTGLRSQLGSIDRELATLRSKKPSLASVDPRFDPTTARRRELEEQRSRLTQRIDRISRTGQDYADKNDPGALDTLRNSAAGVARSLNNLTFGLAGDVAKLAGAGPDNFLSSIDNWVEKNVADAIETTGGRQRREDSARRSAEAGRKADTGGATGFAKGMAAEISSTIKEIASNPGDVALPMIAEQLPNMLGLTAVGRTVAKRAGTKALAKGASKQVAEKAARKAGTRAVVATGAAMQGTDVGSGAYDRVMQLPIETLQADPDFGSYLDEGMSVDEARQALAESVGRKVGATAAAISVITNKYLPTAEKTAIGQAVGKSRVGRAVTTAFGETAQEGLEEGGGQLAANIGIRSIDPEQRLGEGVGQSIAQAAIASGPIGAVTGAISPSAPEATGGRDDIANPLLEQALRTNVARAPAAAPEPAAPQQGMLPSPPSLTALEAPDTIEQRQLWNEVEGLGQQKAMQDEQDRAAAAAEQERLKAFQTEPLNVAGKITTGPKLLAAAAKDKADPRISYILAQPISDQVKADRIAGIYTRDAADLKTVELVQAIAPLIGGTKPLSAAVFAAQEGLRDTAPEIIAESPILSDISRVITGRSGPKEVFDVLRTAVSQPLPRAGNQPPLALPQLDEELTDQIADEAAPAMQDMPDLVGQTLDQEQAPQPQDQPVATIPQAQQMPIEQMPDAQQMPVADTAYTGGDVGAPPAPTPADNQRTVDSISDAARALSDSVAPEDQGITSNEDVEPTLDVADHPRMVEHSQRFDAAIDEVYETENTKEVRSLAKRMIKDGIIDEDSYADIDERIKDADRESKHDEAMSALEDAIEQQRDNTASDLEDEIRNEDPRYYSQRDQDQQTAEEAPTSEMSAEDAQIVIDNALSRLKDRGALGKTAAQRIEQLLASKELSANEAIAAFRMADVASQIVKSNLNIDVQFFPDLTNEETGEKVQGSFQPLPLGGDGFAGVVKLSLSQEWSGIFSETAAHEVFHVLQRALAYGGDAAAKKYWLLNDSFRDGMTLNDLHPSLQRLFKNTRHPRFNESVWTVMQNDPIFQNDDGTMRQWSGFGPQQDSLTELQAYTFGYLNDALRYGGSRKGITASILNAYDAIANFLEAVRNSIKGLGFTSTSKLWRDIASGKLSEQIGDVDVSWDGGDEAQFSARTRNMASLERTFQMLEKRTFKKGRDLKEFIQNRIKPSLEAAGIDTADFESKELYNYLTKSVVNDAEFALKDNANAVGWYDEKVSKALSVLSLVHPEIATDPKSKFAFVWALAVTSNGLKVNPNFELAEKAYSAYKQTGRMPNDIGIGTASEAINGSLNLFNDLMDRFGFEELESFMTTKASVKDIEAKTGLSISGEGKNEQVFGSAILGPKIGNGFFANLYGYFDQLTMDRWLMRTWGRWTGTLITTDEVNVEKSRTRLKALVDGLSAEDKGALGDIIKVDVATADIDQIALAINKASVKPVLREKLNGIAVGNQDFLKSVLGDPKGKAKHVGIGDSIRKAGNGLAKYLDGQKEAPAGANERKFIRKVFGGALSTLQKSYPKLTMADLQALLWYPEKRLYEAAKADEVEKGYEDDNAPDYANAAILVARNAGVGDERIREALDAVDARRRADVGAGGTGRGDSGVSGLPTQAVVNFSARGSQADLAKRLADSFAGTPRVEEGAAREGNVGRRRGGVLADTVTGRVPVAATYSHSDAAKAVFAEKGYAAPDFHELTAGKAAARLYSRLINDSKTDNKFGASVYVYPEGDYADMRLFVTKDGLAGFALKGDDIVSAFKSPKSTDEGVAYSMVRMAVAIGGRRLDAFDTVLPSIYSVSKFRAVTRMRWNDEYAPSDWDKETFKPFNNGEPDVVFMAYDANRTDVYAPNEGEYVDDYDQAVARQTAAVNGDTQFSARTGTPEFRNWFGKSVLTDANGNPQVLYHGTGDSVDRFDLNNPNRKDTGYLGTGVYLTDEPFIANTYANLKQRNKEGGNVMPLYARLENPFYATMADKDRLRNGGRKAADAFTAELKAKGHDGVILEARGGGREIVVFDPAGVKSVNNSGAFNPNDDRLLYSSRTAVYTPERTENIIRQFSYSMDDKKSKGWMTFMSPDDFLGLTLSPKGREILASMDPTRTRAKPLNIEELRNVDQPLFLFVKKAADPSEWQMKNGVTSLPWRVMGHEGRHRMTAFKAAGIDRVPVVLINQDGGGQLETLNDIRLAPQRGGKSDQFSNGDTEFTVPEMVPINYENADRVREMMDGGDVQFSARKRAPIGTPLPAAPRFSMNNLNFGGVDPDLMDDAIYQLQDKLIDVKRLQQNIEKAGKAIGAEANVYRAEELYHGRAAKRAKDFVERELNPLIEDMASKGVPLEVFDEFLHMRHAKERNEQIRKVNPDMQDGGSGKTDAEVDAYMNALPNARRVQLENLAKRVDAIVQGTQKMLVDYGLETQDTINTWNATYKSYVPLMREGFEEEFSGAGSQGSSVRGGSSRRALGSSLGVVDVLANVAQQRERAITRGERNRVGNALTQLALQNPNDGFWFVIDPKSDTLQEATAKLINFGVDPIDAQNIVGNPIERFIDPRSGRLVVRPNTRIGSAANVMATRINGEDRFVIFNARNPRAARSVAALKNLDTPQIGGLLNAVGKGTRYFASINTQYNPAFGLYNLMRDISGATINLTSTPIANQKAKVISNVWSALSGMYSDLRTERKGGTATSQWAKLAEEFELAGGKTGFRDLFRNSQERAEAIENALSPSKGAMAWMKTGKPVFDWLSDFNEAIENSVRLSAYKVAKDMGMSQEEAASIAKNITVNFNRKGAMGTQAGMLYAFFNASVQGSARIAETLSGPTGKKIVLGGLMLGLVQAVALAAAGFGDDEIPDWLKDKNLVIPVGNGRYVAIPMPLGYHVIPSLSRRAAEFFASDSKSGVGEFVELFSLIADGFNPIGNGGTLAETLSPTLTDPVVQLATNRDFAGRPIYQQDFNNLDPTPGPDRTRDGASIIGEYTSLAIDRFFGGNGYVPGKFSPTGDQVDFVIGTLTGGAGRTVLNTVSSAKAAVTGEDLPNYKIPILGRMIGDKNEAAAVSSRFYEGLKELNSYQRTLKGMDEDGVDPSDYLNDNPAAMFADEGADYERAITALKKEKKQLVEEGASKEDVNLKTEELQQVMAEFNQRLADYKRSEK